MKTIIGYKWLTGYFKSAHGNETWTTGEWKEYKGKLELCNSGFHACRTPLQSLSYIYGNKWVQVEAEGRIIEEENNKFVCSRMRVIKELPAKEILLEFAIACAKSCLFRYEQKYRGDNRPRKAIEATGAAEAAGAAAEAAGAAAKAAWAAGAAEAAWAAWAAWAAAKAAGTAEAAWAAEAAGAAAEAAWAAERKWQNQKLERIISRYL